MQALGNVERGFLRRRTALLTAEGKGLAASRQPVLARRAFERAYDLMPTCPVLLEWARFEHGDGDTAYALALCAQAISRDPSSQEANQSYAMYLRWLGREEEATEWLAGLAVP